MQSPVGSWARERRVLMVRSTRSRAAFFFWEGISLEGLVDFISSSEERNAQVPHRRQSIGKPQPGKY